MTYATLSQSGRGPNGFLSRTLTRYGYIMSHDDRKLTVPSLSALQVSLF